MDVVDMRFTVIQLEVGREPYDPTFGNHRCNLQGSDDSGLQCAKWSDGSPYTK